MVADLIEAVTPFADLLYAVLVFGLALAALERGIAWFRKGAE